MDDQYVNTTFKALSFLLRKTYQLSSKSKDAPNDITDIISFLREITSSKPRKAALTCFFDFRNAWAHEKINSISWDDLSESLPILHEWLTKLNGSGFLLILSETLIALCRSITTKNVDLNKDPFDDDSTNSTSSTEDICSDVNLDITNPIGCKITCHEAIDLIDEGDFVLKGSLRELKNNGYREKLKGRKILILDGKHSHQIGVFCTWSGTVAYIKLGSKKIALSINRNIAVLRN